MLSVTAAVSFGSRFHTPSDTALAAASPALASTGNSFSQELQTLLQSAGASDAGQTGEIPAVAGEGSSLAAIAGAPASEIATTGAGAAHTTGKRSRDFEAPAHARCELTLLPGAATAQDAAAAGSSSTHVAQALATTYASPASSLAVAQASLPLAAESAGKRTTAVEGSQHSAQSAVSATTVVPPANPLSRTTTSEMVQASAPATAASEDIVAAATPSPSGGGSAPAAMQTALDGAAASRSDIMPAAPVAPEPTPPRPELAFGARVSPASQASATDSTVGRSANTAADAARETAATPAVSSINPGAGRPANQNGAAFEHAAGRQSANDAQHASENESFPAIPASTAAASSDSGTAKSVSAAPVAHTAMPAGEEATTNAKAPVRELSLRMSGDSTQSADVRLVERNGEIQVSVRASDPRLAESLRANVNDLVGNLSRNDLTAEVWRPGGAAQKSSAPDARQHSDGGAPSDQPGDDSSSHSGGQRNGQENRQPPDWMEELDAVPARTSARSSTR